MAVTVEAEGLAELEQYFATMPDRANKAAAAALNKVGGGTGLTLLRHATQDAEVEFPSGYVNADRMYFAKRAGPNDLEVKIGARDQPTSLARFAEPGTPLRKAGVKVTVHRGKQTLLKKAFLLPLRSGNVGLAVRLKAGETFSNTTGAREIESARTSNTQLYLLYGPSVDQVFRGIAEDNLPEILEMVSDEFVRQFARGDF